MSKFTYTTRKDGRFQKTLQVNGVKKYFVSNDEKELEKMYNEAKYLSDKGIVLNNDSITFKQYAERWFEINCTTKEKATQESIKNRLNHLYDYIGNIKLRALKPYHIQNFVTEMIKNGYTDITKRCLGECKRILNDAIINDIIMKNVANGITTPKFTKKERIPLTLEQDKKVCQCALNHKYGLFILIIRYCGLRPEEAVALTTDDIDLDNKQVIINKAVSLFENQPELKATKNLKNRKVPIPDFLFNKLENAILENKKNGINYIFTKETNKHSMLTKTALKRHLSSFLHELNKNEKESIKFSYYQLRHSYCTMLYYANVKIKKAQELMGHSSADMVYNIYTHLDEQRENAEELINDYISTNIIKKRKLKLKVCQKVCHYSKRIACIA